MCDCASNCPDWLCHVHPSPKSTSFFQSSPLNLNLRTPQTLIKQFLHNMAGDQPVAPSVAESETWDVCTPSATSENTTKNPSIGELPQSSIPSPGRTFIIQSRQDGKVITFLDGEVVLDKIGGLGTFRWRCVEEKGWMGFKDPASALYLGYHEHGLLCCRAPHHKNNEYICPRLLPGGGWALLVRQSDHLRPLGVLSNEADDTRKRKIKIAHWTSEGIAWDFIEVQSQE